MSSCNLPTICVPDPAHAADGASAHQDALSPPCTTSRTSQDLVAASSRSSFTRVGHDDEQRVPQTASHDPVNPLITLPTLSQPATTIPSNDQTLSVLAIAKVELQDSKETSETTPLPELSMNDPVPQMPQTYLTFLIISGKRRTMSFEPNTSIARVKELVWNSWPTDWQDVRPPAPSYLRVLYLGRMLQDDETLNYLKLPSYTPHQRPSSPSHTGPTPTIVHLSIRPYPPPGEGDAIKKKKKRVPDNAGAINESNAIDDGAGCCRCIIC